MAGDAQEPEDGGSSPEGTPPNRVARERFNTVEKSAGLPGAGLVALAVMGVILATAAAGFVAWETAGDSETASAPAPAAAPPFHSRVASVCDVGWKDDRLNRDQIHCWLTRDAMRLCDPRERAALAGRLVDYEAAKERKDGRLRMATWKTVLNPEMSEMTYALARSTDTRLSPEQREAEAEKAAALSEKINAPTNKVLEESSNNETAPGVTIQDFADLVEAGYLIPADFPDPTPGLAVKGFLAAAPARAHPCKR